MFGLEPLLLRRSVTWLTAEDGLWRKLLVGSRELGQLLASPWLLLKDWTEVIWFVFLLIIVLVFIINQFLFHIVLEGYGWLGV